ncbi:hypothetical protein [Streptomyces sp. NPDC001530]
MLGEFVLRLVGSNVCTEDSITGLVSTGWKKTHSSATGAWPRPGTTGIWN